MVSFLVQKYLLLCVNSPIIQRELPKYEVYIYPCNCCVILSLAEGIGGKLFSLCEEDHLKEYEISNLGQLLLKELKEKVDNSIMALWIH